LSDSKQPGDFVLLHQELKPLSELPDDALLAAHHFCQINADFFKFESVSSGLVLSEMKVIRGQQKRFAWDATDVETGASQNLAVVDNRRIQAELSGTNRSSVSGWASPHNNEIERRHGDMLHRNVKGIKERWQKRVGVSAFGRLGVSALGRVGVGACSAAFGAAPDS
jgi:hypothetical protein